MVFSLHLFFFFLHFCPLVGAALPQCIRKWKNEIGGVSRETIEAAIKNVQREWIRIYCRISFRFTKGNWPRFLELFTKHCCRVDLYTFTESLLSFLMFAFERIYTVLYAPTIRVGMIRFSQNCMPTESKTH